MIGNAKICAAVGHSCLLKVGQLGVCRSAESRLQRTPDCKMKYNYASIELIVVIERVNTCRNVSMADVPTFRSEFSSFRDVTNAEIVVSDNRHRTTCSCCW